MHGRLDGLGEPDVTGYRSAAMRHDCGVDGCYQERLPSWDWMQGCFPRGIRPTDVDGMVEINGRVLFIEQKGCGAPLPNGQRLAMKALSEKDGVTVLFMRATADVAVLDCLVFDGTPPQGWQPFTLDGLRHWLGAWADAADAAVPA